MSLGTAGTGGIYYPLGGAIASRMSVLDSLRQYTAEVSGGSVENVNRVRVGQVDLAFATGYTVFEAFSGGQDYPEPVTSLRILAPLYPNLTHVVVPEGSTAQSVADLTGAVVSVGAAGSGTEQMSRQVLEVYGLTYDDITPRYLSFGESASALKDGAIDAAIISVGYPAAAVLEATTTAGARLLAIDQEHADALSARYPYYLASAIPAGAYPGVEDDVATVGILNWVIGQEDLSEDVVSVLLRVVAEEREALEQVHEMARQIDVNTLPSAPIPLHPTTSAWLSER